MTERDRRLYNATHEGALTNRELHIRDAEELRLFRRFLEVRGRLRAHRESCVANERHRSPYLNDPDALDIDRAFLVRYITGGT